VKLDMAVDVSTKQSLGKCYDKKIDYKRIEEYDIYLTHVSS
jgi:hypothetical protein